MNTSLSKAVLKRQNRHFHGKGGRSQENRAAGFRPAFMDTDTRAVYPSCFRDGRPAPFHLLDGLPAHVVVRDAQGRVASVKAGIVAGFLRAGRFYTREEAGRCVARLAA